MHKVVEGHFAKAGFPDAVHHQLSVRPVSIEAVRELVSLGSQAVGFGEQSLYFAASRFVFQVAQCAPHHIHASATAFKGVNHIGDNLKWHTQRDSHQGVRALSLVSFRFLQ